MVENHDRHLDIQENMFKKFSPHLYVRENALKKIPIAFVKVSPHLVMLQFNLDSSFALR
jgi:hypothetical protein